MPVIEQRPTTLLQARRNGKNIGGAECQQDYLSGAPPSVGAERTRKFLTLQTPQVAGNGTSRVFYAHWCSQDFRLEGPTAGPDRRPGGGVQSEGVPLPFEKFLKF